MPATLSLSKKLVQRSDRVKSVDMHPTEPWVLCGLYSGNAIIYNYSTQSVLKTFPVCALPVRCAKFIARKQWIVVGSDDMQIRVYNYNTMDKITMFEGHQDYIRYLEVHPTLPYILSTSDDMTIRLWDWDKGFSCTRVFEGHSHYVMMARFNPKDPNTFASASLDRSIKVWSLNSALPNCSLEGHERGVNCVDYYPGGDKPYLVSGADDFTVRVWDYQTRLCVSVLEGHTGNICAVAFHPRMPFILSGSEDGTVRIWHNATYNLDTTLNYGFERAWAIGVNAANNKVALGFDEGTIVVKLGKEVPVASMDKNGKIVIARNNVLHTASVRTVSLDDDLEDDFGASPTSSSAATTFVDGEKIHLSERELGTIDLFPQQVLHNPTGRFLVVSGDNEFVIYTSQALRNKTFGQATDFVWSSFGTGDYGIRVSSSKVKIFKNFKETADIRPPISCDAISGGALFSVRSNESVCFYDWDTGRMVRSIDVSAKNVFWNEEGTLVAIATEESFFVLSYNRDVWINHVASGRPIPEDGLEEAFELKYEIAQKISSANWVGDVLIYTTSTNHLNYFVGGESMTLAYLDKRMYILGYLAKEGRVFLIDKTNVIISFALNISLLQYQTAIVRGDFATANRLLQTIPKDLYNSIAKFLDARGFKEEALEVTDDPEMKFDLSIQLKKLDTAHALLQAEAKTTNEDDLPEMNSKWKQLTDLALSLSDINLAESCALAIKDLPTLLLIYSSLSDEQGLLSLAKLAEEERVDNIAYLAYMSIGRSDLAQQFLSRIGRSMDAAAVGAAYKNPIISNLSNGNVEEITESLTQVHISETGDNSYVASAEDNYDNNLRELVNQETEVVSVAEDSLSLE